NSVNASSWFRPIGRRLATRIELARPAAVLLVIAIAAKGTRSSRHARVPANGSSRFPKLSEFAPRWSLNYRREQYLDTGRAPVDNPPALARGIPSPAADRGQSGNPQACGLPGPGKHPQAGLSRASPADSRAFRPDGRLRWLCR